jgi:hypothetical protein
MALVNCKHCGQQVSEKAAMCPHCGEQLKTAYELIYDVAQSFKNPSSVRLVSGTLGVDKDCMFCGISATNGYGARSTSYYFVMDGWALEEEDDISSLYKEKDGLNFDLINKMLAKTLNVND